MTAARISVRVTPRAARNSIDGWSDDVSLRMHVTAAPHYGKANEAVRRLLAKALYIPTRDVQLTVGNTAQTKIIEIEGLSLDDVRTRLRITGAGGAS